MPEPLDYSSLPIYSARIEWLRKWLNVIPPWIMALFLLAPVMVLRLVDLGEPGDLERATHYAGGFLPFVVLGVVGSVRRLDWRQVLLMSCVAGALYGLEEAISRWELWPPYPFNYSMLPIICILATGIGELFVLRVGGRIALIWILLLSVTVGCFVSLITTSLDFTDLRVSISNPVGGSRIATWTDIMYWPLLIALTWNAIPAALKLRRDSKRWKQVAAISLGAASALIFCLYFLVLIYPIARRSLLGGRGPFSRGWAAVILVRGGRADAETITEALEHADWSKSEYDDRGPWDYRRICIDALVARDRHFAARRLAEMLQIAPSDSLAGYSAFLMAKERQYDTVPLLLRYASLDNDQCIDALETIKLPEAGLVILWQAAAHDRPNLLASDFPINAWARKRLTSLLGKDAGPNLGDWTTYYDSKAGQFSTPLPEPIAVETTRVVNSMAAYHHASGRLYKAMCQVYVTRMKKDGHDGDLDWVDSRQAMMSSRKSLSDADLTGVDPSAVQRMDSYLQSAREDMRVTPPNWNAPGTKGLEREVQSYIERVDAMIAKYRIGVVPSTSAPTPRDGGETPQ